MREATLACTIYSVHGEGKLERFIALQEEENITVNCDGLWMRIIRRGGHEMLKCPLEEVIGVSVGGGLADVRLKNTVIRLTGDASEVSTTAQSISGGVERLTDLERDVLDLRQHVFNLENSILQSPRASSVVIATNSTKNRHIVPSVGTKVSSPSHPSQVGTVLSSSGPVIQVAWSGPGSPHTVTSHVSEPFETSGLRLLSPSPPAPVSCIMTPPKANGSFVSISPSLKGSEPPFSMNNRPRKVSMETVTSSEGINTPARKSSCVSSTPEKAIQLDSTIPVGAGKRLPLLSILDPDLVSGSSVQTESSVAMATPRSNNTQGSAKDSKKGTRSGANTPVGPGSDKSLPFEKLKLKLSKAIQNRPFVTSPSSLNSTAVNTQILKTACRWCGLTATAEHETRRCAFRQLTCPHCTQAMIARDYPYHSQMCVKNPKNGRTSAPSTPLPL